MYLDTEQGTYTFLPKLNNGSKNRCGSLDQCVSYYAVPEMIPQCLLFLLDFYLSKLPLYAYTEDVLYCRPKAKVPVNDASLSFLLARTNRVIW